VVGISEERVDKSSVSGTTSGDARGVLFQLAVMVVLISVARLVRIVLIMLLASRR